jgi:flagellar protein FlaJ
MSCPEVMRILAENDGTYGHAAREVGVAVRNVDLFGADVVTAVKTMARRTPSTQFQEFAENLSSVLQTGGSLSEFLHRQYREFRQEAEAQQQRLLEMVATLAEVYVTGLVAGPLFLITLLVVAAISVGGVLPVLRLLVYVLLPLANVGFIVYVGTVVDTLGREEPAPEDVRVNAAPAGVRRARDRLREAAGDRTAIEPERAATDGGVEAPALSAVDRANLARLAAYERYRQLQRRLGSPLRTVVRRPTTLLWVTFPVAVFLVGIRLPGTLADGVLTVAEFDDLLIQSILFLAGTFAVAYEVHRRRVDAIEAVVPDMLDRLASLNEAGMTVVESLDRVRESDLGALDREVETIWADVQWGADVQTALRRFERRVRTQTVSRIVTLTTEAMRASGDVGAVLRIAADQAKSDRRLKEERRQEMFFYVLVVYISFFVFLFIVGVLSEVLIPQLPEGGIVANATASDDVTTIPAVENLGNFDEAAFRLLFLHTVVVQGTFSGLVAGQLSTGDLRAGAKHVTVLVAVGYGLLLVFV